MSLEAFKQSQHGARIAPILSSPDSIAAMEDKSRAGRPAVEASGSAIAQSAGLLDDEQKKLIGRWVKELLGPRGWVPSKKGRVAPGNFFARGTVYRREGQAPAPGRLDARSRVAAARAILAHTPHPIMSSDELIADRRHAFERGE